ERLATGLNGTERAAALRLVGAEQAIEPTGLSPTQRALFDTLTGPPPPTAAAQGSPLGPVLRAVQSASDADLSAALGALRQMPEALFGNRLLVLQAYVRERGTREEYRQFVARIQATGVARALNEADPLVNAEVEREGGLNLNGGSSPLTDD